VEEKKNWLKENRWKDVLQALRPFLEAPNIPDPEARVRACLRYISNRPNFLDYPAALAAGLPIGSGEIKSAHRYVIQNRLKIAGAWWKIRQPQQDARSSGGASEPRMGRLLEQPTGGSIN
jgi:hypothetical protein